MAERHAPAPHAAVRGGDAGGLAAGDASRATGTSVATVTTSLAAVELCDEDVAMRCSAQSDAGSAADPEWEAVLAQLLAEEAEEEELCCRFERCGDDSDNGTYVGASPDPVRRLRQHNGELSGGGAPAAGRPWRILLVVCGFSSKSDALAFEWAWQKPHTSRHIARQWGV
ncbi:hypothetical protein EMIHUDRAFT_250660 [Emiliania huxleyi CCMP1516]|uniref:GIY-YIG domain-containing protein n=2 Tax=Emiliania huxleyi TaxID=2903 RepID=A0A0D3HYT7_EMIH1|nr:hypothetical protein EMIHUDRAFT_250660 [Emiliania huxleyi CCMP1516]EOD04172.1 hypothetical protein EMIHUDRAFT_250660 [Emiliania huxleyi CCMP1516]|eukprot:XP_005756601.1 hypothetical protein EMIHUDRAFT_250660 [Emiliania huxleyi CCMP1516]